MPDRTAPELQAEIRKLTSDFRDGTDAFWGRLRSLLRGRGIEPKRAVLATVHSEDTNQWLGIVVSPERSVFRFIFNYVNRAIDAAELSEWEELTDKRTDSEYRAYVGLIECALDLVPRARSN